MTKPVYSTLRRFGYTSVGYIDDSLLVSDSYAECEQNIDCTKKLFEKLGFIVHEKKSVLHPCQRIHFLGFIIDSSAMKVYLPEEKCNAVIKSCCNLRDKSTVKIRQLAEVIGKIISTFSAVEYGQLFYRKLETAKIAALKDNYGDFDKNVLITQDMKTELNWWVNNLRFQSRNIIIEEPNRVIYTDSSSQGWGLSYENVKIGERWTEDEKSYQINYLELLPVFYALKAVCSQLKKSTCKNHDR
ncbi:hypothetical protein SNE40_009675 [Patella caerulea]|uniref:Reverse transcriptase domain-containing protein n=1 Tax=Patella caerulea TaxID=87958 RepID=A0AAN8JRR2_PATCE